MRRWSRLFTMTQLMWAAPSLQMEQSRVAEVQQRCIVRRSAAQRMIGYNEARQEGVVLHFGDHDPSGIDMTRDIRERLRIFGAEVDVRRVALNMDQVQQYTPPPNPAKQTDSRFDGYLDLYGDKSWELDALEPRVLRDLVETNVLAFRDEAAWDAARAADARERANLTTIARCYQDVIDGL